MEAAIRVNHAGRDERAVVPTAALYRGLLLIAIWLIALAAGVLVARRLAGALVEPLPSGVLIATGVTATAAVAVTRSCSRQIAVSSLLSISLLLIGVALSLPGSSWPGLIMLWLAVAGEEVWAWRAWRRPAMPRVDVAWRRAAGDGPPLRHEVEPSASAEGWASLALADSAQNGQGPVPAVEVIEADADWTDSTLTQQLKYHRDAAGGLTVEGWLRAEFAAGQRVASVHLAFCPAFSRTPQVETEPLDGPDCQIRPTLTLPWGIRWEVKLSRAANGPASVVVGFMAFESTDS